MGNTAKANQIFEQVPKFKRKHYSWDEYASRKSKQFLKSGICANEQALLLVYNHTKSGQFIEAEEMLKTLDPSNLAPDLQAYFFYLKGRAQFLQKEFSQAEAFFQMVLEIKGIQKETYLQPFSLYRLVQLYIEQGDLERAWQMIHQLESSKSFFKSYDFEKPLRRKIVSIKEKLENN